MADINKTINDLEKFRKELFEMHEWWEESIVSSALALLKEQQPKKGHWKDNGNGTISCSECSTWFPKEREPYLLFCGYCGADMRKDGE